MTSISCGALPVYAGSGVLESGSLTTRAGDFKRTWRRGIHLIGSTRAYADLFTHLQADGIIPPLRDGGSVLDYGIGTVAFSLALTSVRVQINGMDINPFMYATPSRSARRAGLNVEVFHGHDQHLPFAPASFDLVVGTHRLVDQDHQFNDLQEIWRVLRPGAPVIMIAHTPDRSNHSDISGTPSRLIDMMQHIGLADVRQYNVAGSDAVSRQFEVACIGFKPLSDTLPLLSTVDFGTNQSDAGSIQRSLRTTGQFELA